MKALRHHKDGLKIGNIAIPSTGPKDVLIRVHATAITRGELEWPESVERQNPIPGHDVAGSIESIGAEVTKFQNGDEVFGLISFTRDGAAAEYVLAAEHELCMKPSQLPFEDAAAISLSSLTVWQTFFDHLDAKEGQKVLITGAGGGVGVMLLQIGHWAKLKISATCSAAKSNLVRSLGASEIFDYNKISIDDLPTDFDAVVDCVGGETLKKSFHRLKQGGRLISLVRPLVEEETAQRPDVMSKFFIVE
jgi:NADPH:quinone reductase-like Zn-dependent oxidoreductase